MRRTAIFSLLALKMLTACSGGWGEWFPQDPPDEDKKFWCGYYKNCPKSNDDEG